MIILVKSLNNSILGKLGFKHWYFVDTKKNLVYSYDYEIKWDKFVNGKVKTFTFSAYEKEVSKWIEITKLPYFDLSKYLDYSNENSTCMDFCLFVLNKEWIYLKLYNSINKEYARIINKLRLLFNRIFSLLERFFWYIITFIIWILFWIPICLYIMSTRFDLAFNLY